MITVCSVSLNVNGDGVELNTSGYFEIFKESIATRTKLVSEVLIARVDRESSFEESWTENGISFTQFGVMEGRRPQQCYEHGLGLHKCIERAKNDYLLFCDVDIFFHIAVDELYFKLLEEHELNAVGVSHASALRCGHTFFPCVINLLVKKSDLPDDNFLKGKILDDIGEVRDGKYLMRVKNKESIPVDKYPNPNGDFDTGAYLWYWAHLNDWKWLSFQTMDVHNYYEIHNRGNVKLSNKFKKRNLLYHATSATASEETNFIEFKEAWENSTEK